MTTKKKFRERWHKLTIANQLLTVSSILLMVCTVGLVFVSTLQYLTASKQLNAMRDMISQNERLIQASSDQAHASAKSATIAQDEKQAVLDSAKAAKDSASAAKILTEQNSDLVAAARTQANASQVSARAGEQSVRISAEAMDQQRKLMNTSLEAAKQSHLEEMRPYVSVKTILSEPSESQPGTLAIVITYDNAGRTPALHIGEVVFVEATQGEPDLSNAINRPFLERARRPPFQGPFQVGVIGSGSTYQGTPQRLTEGQIKQVTTQRHTLVVSGYVGYEDQWRNPHTTFFCFQSSDLSKWGHCRSGNLMN